MMSAIPILQQRRNESSPVQSKTMEYRNAEVRAVSPLGISMSPVVGVGLVKPVALKAVRPVSVQMPVPIRPEPKRGTVQPKPEPVRPVAVSVQPIKPIAVRQLAKPVAARPGAPIAMPIGSPMPVAQGIPCLLPLKPVARRGITAPQVVKPLAIRAIRPTVQQATELFYDQVYREGVKGSDVQAAIMEAHDWHRKWTYQDEEGHTMPETGQHDDNDQFQVLVEPEFVFDREAGARNPSPGDVINPDSSPSDDGNRKRVRRSDGDEDSPTRATTQFPVVEVMACEDDQNQLSLSTLYDSSDSYGSEEDQSKESSIRSPSGKRQFGAVRDSECENMGTETNPLPQSVVRPVAVRPDAVRPDAVRPVAVHPVAVRPIAVRPIAVRPVAVRPVAVRPVAVRPVAVRPLQLTMPVQDTLQMDARVASQIPQHILESVERNVSPLTVVSVYEQSVSSNGNICINADLEGEPKPAEAVEFPSLVKPVLTESLAMTRDNVLRELVVNGGDGATNDFQEILQPLANNFTAQEVDTRFESVAGTRVEGTWLTLTKPTFFGCLGMNDNDDPLYTLGRMSFDMFSPCGLICSLQGNFNEIEVVNDQDKQELLDAGLVPKGLREEVEKNDCTLRTYNIITAFTIEPPMAAYPNAPNKVVRTPIRGIMSTYGYTIPDPETPNRHSIWITGGKIEPNNLADDIREWKRLFSLYPPKHTFGEKAKLLAVKLLMGANIPESMNPEDGRMEYSFTRPLGGHGVAYIDVEYVDSSLRIARGHRGTRFVFSRLENCN